MTSSPLYTVGGVRYWSSCVRDTMTTEPGHIMFVDNFGMSRVVVVVVVGGSEERLEVCYEKERDGVLLFYVIEFQLTILGVGILDLLR